MHRPLRLHRPRVARLSRGLLSRLHKHSTNRVQEVLARSLDQTGEGELCRDRQTKERALFD